MCAKRGFLHILGVTSVIYTACYLHTRHMNMILNLHCHSHDNNGQTFNWLNSIYMVYKL